MTDAEKKAREISEKFWKDWNSDRASTGDLYKCIASALAAERERALEEAINACEARRDKHEADSALQAEDGYEQASDHYFDLQMEALRCAQDIRSLKGK